MIPVKQMLHTGAKFCRKNAPTILAILAGAGVAATEYFSIKAGMRLQEDLINLPYSKFDEGCEDVTKKDIAKVIVKDVAAPTAMAGVTIAMIVSSNIISIRRAKAMAASYAILSESAEVFRRKCIEEMGEHREDKVRGKISQEKFNEEYEKYKDEIMALGGEDGTYLFRDGITGQFFRCTAEIFWKRINKLNSYYISGEDFVSVSDYCGIMGLQEPCEYVRNGVWPSAMQINPDLDSVICPNGEPGYDIYFGPGKEPMSEELAEIYNTNNYISSTYEY